LRNLNLEGYYYNYYRFRYQSSAYCNKVPGRVSEDIFRLLVDFVLNFYDEGIANRSLGVSMILANIAFLNEAAQYNDPNPIRDVQGAPIEIISASHGGIIAVSVLLGLQLLLLFLLILFIYRTPTWTGTFDSLALARIGAALKNDVDLLPLNEIANIELRQRLLELSGIIGVAELQTQHGGEEADGHELSALPTLQIYSIETAPIETATEWTVTRQSNRMTSSTSSPLPTMEHHSQTSEDLGRGSTHEGDTVGSLSLRQDPFNIEISRQPSPPPAYMTLGGSEASPQRMPYTLVLGGTGIINRKLYRQTRRAAKTRAP
jgi:hypothetical protein